MMNRKLALGYAGWREMWQLAKDKKAGLDSMSRALSYFVNRELSREYVGWHATGRRRCASRRCARR